MRERLRFRSCLQGCFTATAPRISETPSIKKANLNKEETAFAERLVALATEHEAEFLELLTQKVTGYSEQRIYPADKAAMLVALAEIKYCDDVPPVVSVSEATAIAKKYSAENSAAFVNGVLGGIINS